MFYKLIKQHCNKYLSFIANNNLIFEKWSRNFCTTISLSSENGKHFSKLYVSAKYGQELRPIVKPSYDFDYLNYIANNIDKIQDLFDKRSIKNEYSLDEIKKSIYEFMDYLKKTESLKNKRKKLEIKFKNNANNEVLNEKFQTIHKEFIKYRNNLYHVEEKLIPFLLNIPNDVETLIDNNITLIDEQMSKYFDPNCHNYVRLGYINHLYQTSIIGPNAYYLTNQGAQLYYGLINLITDALESDNFVPITGLDIVKSGIVEAVNYRQFNNDQYMLRTSTGKSEESQRLHLVGDASLESICCFLSKHNINRGKFYQTGSMYQTDTIKQIHAVRATILTDANQSTQVMKDLYGIYWNILTRLGINRCSIKTDIKSLYTNEFDKYILMAWLRSSNEWIQIGQITNYHCYISQRLGLADYRQCLLISSFIDLIPLIHTIVEHYQTYETGLIDLPPEVLKNFY